MKVNKILSRAAWGETGLKSSDDAKRFGKAKFFKNKPECYSLVGRASCKVPRSWCNSTDERDVGSNHGNAAV